MRRLILLVASALAVGVATPSLAGLDLSWRGCPGDGGVSRMNLDCSQPDSIARLFGCFQLPKTIERFTAVDIVLEFRSGERPLPPFWHFEHGGCNNTGIVLSNTQPPVGCSGAENPWGDEGSAALSFITLYQPDYTGSDRARMFCTIARSSESPIMLQAGVNYFGFDLRIFTDRATNPPETMCKGCQAPLAVTWSSATFYSVPSRPDTLAAEPVIVTSPGRLGWCALLNGADSKLCAAVVTGSDSTKALPAIERVKAQPDSTR